MEIMNVNEGMKAQVGGKKAAERNGGLSDKVMKRKRTRTRKKRTRTRRKWTRTREAGLNGRLT